MHLEAGKKPATAFTGLLSLLLLSAACTHVMYGGSRRGTEEVALLVKGNMQQSGHWTDVAKIDGVQVSGSKFELLPGRHSVEIQGTMTPSPNTGMLGVGGGVLAAAAVGAANGAWIEEHTEKSGNLVTCFVARPGRRYEVRAYGQGAFWVTEIIDQTTTYDVKSPCESPSKPVSSSLGSASPSASTP